MKLHKIIITVVFLISATTSSHAWFDETHLAIAKAAGYKQWYNAAAPDIARAKLGKMEGYNHYHNSPRGIVITPEMVLEQTERYDKFNQDGHLYGAIIGSLRAYVKTKPRGRYAEHLFAYLVHYIGDLSMPLHHTMNNFSKKNHLANDGIIEEDVLRNLDKIRIYEIIIKSEAELATEVARIANLSMALGRTLENENRLMTQHEARRQISHSASLLRAILEWMERT
ncbi:MAG: hypothetical protein VR64_16670 [Desulfatitalea sp. BRH_c12]|nr:MAG: hypothetical protein VR64_16670 [Desulfatitalea sp. BRH_c12]